MKTAYKTCCKACGGSGSGFFAVSSIQVPVTALAYTKSLPEVMY